MTSTRLDPGFLWWRARDYVIKHDVLKPAADPEPYILSPRSTVWSELTGLTGAHSGEPLTATAKRNICSWCSRYGLPGYLLQTTQAIWLPAVSNSGRTQQTAIVYERAGGRWITNKVTIRADDDDGEPGPPGPYVARLVRGDLTRKAQPAVVPEGFLTCVIVRDAASSWLASAEAKVDERTSLKRLTDHLTCAADHCPQPGTEAFWRVYQEPVEDFFRAARLLRWIQSAVAAAGTGDDPTAILSQLALSGWIKSPNGETAWTGASLLAAYASELLTAHGGFSRCIQAGCGAVFLPDRSDQKYCTSRCRDRDSKRRRRSKPPQT